MTTKVSAAVLATNAAAASQVADDSVDTAALQDLAVTSTKLAADAVTTAKILDSNVTDTKIATGAVTAAKLGALAVTAAKIDADAVTTAKILDLNVTSGKIADSAITVAKMAPNNVNTAQLIDGAVINAKILDGTIAQAKLAFTPLTLGNSTVWVPARAISPSPLNGASSTVVSFASDTKPSYPVITFSTSVKQYAEFAVFMPKSYNLGSIIARFVWAHPTTSVNFGVRWEISKLHTSNADNINTALGSIFAITDTGGALDTMYMADAITMSGGGPASLDVCFFKVARDVTHAGDLMAVPAYLIGVALEYTLDKSNDT